MIKGQVRILVMSVLFCILGAIAYSDPKYGIPTVGVEFREPGHVAVGAIYDSRLRSAKNCNSKMQLRSFSTAREWLTYRDELRTHIMVSYGLLPAWKKTPLNAHVFDTIVRDDYKVSNVVFESVPGFYVCGNLYEPIAGKGPFPVVLNPMGHWKSRFRHDEPEHPNGCSIPARCITFARQGYVAFSWSIVGGDDMNAISHKGGEMNDWT